MRRPPPANEAPPRWQGAPVVSAAGELRTGFAFLVRGVRFLISRPGFALLGMLPPLIVGALMLALFVALAVFALAPLTAAMTGWVPESLHMIARALAGIVIMISAGVIALILFSAVTMVVGAPVYERISVAAEAEVGVAVDVAPESAWAGILRGTRQGLALLAIAALGGVVVFLIGLIPFVGGPVAVVAGAILAGGLITAELTSGVFDRRGERSLAEKFAALRRRRMVTVGFGVTLFVVFSVPLMSVIMFPAATAGATMLAIEVSQRAT